MKDVLRLSIEVDKGGRVKYKWFSIAVILALLVVVSLQAIEIGTLREALASERETVKALLVALGVLSF
ncbi:hypothetical protein ES703_77624 [subsurface metagenome]